MIYDIVITSLKSATEIDIEFERSTPIFGDESIIDSMDLVNAIMAIEEVLEEQQGLSIEIIDEQALIGKESPFRTVDTLTKHIEKKLNINNSGE